MNRTARISATAVAAAFALATALGTPAQASPTQTFHVTLDSLNSSGASGVANLRLKGDELTVVINARGLAPGLPHAQHLHYSESAQHVCPPPSAAGDDGVLTVAEGAPFYGGIDVSLTVNGDTTSASGLALDRFPVAKANGTLHYKRTITLTPAQIQHVTDFVVVQHGIDKNANGTYEGLPEASLPSDCGIAS